MNPLKEHPHLFANGEFRVRIKWDNGDKEIVPLKINTKGKAIAGLESSKYTNKPSPWPYNFDGLIARPIEDMTDEEISEVMGEPNPEKLRPQDIDYYRGQLLLKSDTDSLLGRHERNMADIGVYFGPQFHFDDGTVIDKNKL